MKGGQTILASIEYDSFSQVLNVTISPTSSKPRSPICHIKWIFHQFFTAICTLAFLPQLGYLQKLSPLDISSLPSLPGPPKNYAVLIIGVFVSSLVLIISICAIAFYTIRKIRNADVIEDWEFEIGLTELIGLGGFGKVYKGTLSNSNYPVAVKRILHESKQGLREFISEISSIGKPTTSSDVFAFGALLLEVVCGRRPIERKALPEELILVDWVWDKWKEGAILEAIDPRLNGEFDEFEALVVLKLGLICSNDAPQMRPTMRQVVRYLEGEITIPEMIAPLEACGVKMGGGGGNEFEDFVHSYCSSSLNEKVSTWSSVGDGDVDIEAGLVSISPSSPSSKGNGIRNGLFIGPFEAVDGEGHKKLSICGILRLQSLASRSDLCISSMILGNSVRDMDCTCQHSIPKEPISLYNQTVWRQHYQNISFNAIKELRIQAETGS
ncbi:hypothetical protein RJ641_005581, partial [Dillenia turbinata]